MIVFFLSRLIGAKKNFRCWNLLIFRGLHFFCWLGDVWKLRDAIFLKFWYLPPVQQKIIQIALALTWIVTNHQTCQDHCIALTQGLVSRSEKHLQSTFCQQQNPISFFTITFLFIFISSDEFSSIFVEKFITIFIALNFKNTTNLKDFSWRGKLTEIEF